MLESLFFVQFGLASWLAISREFVSLQLKVNLGGDTHTHTHLKYIPEFMVDQDSF